MDSNARFSRRRFLLAAAAAGAGLVVESGSPASADAPVAPAPPQEVFVEASVHLNQVGYLPLEPKRAVIPASGPIHGGGFVLVDDDITPRVRYQGTLKESVGAAPYGPAAHHYFADFDDFTQPGRYRLRLSDGHLSPPFSIGVDIYERLVPLVLNYFDIQRCGDQHSVERGPCHLDDGVIVGGPRDGQTMDAAGGWHDAGDYLKFVETTSYVAAVMLYAYDRYRAQYEKTSKKTPTDALPLLLEYAKVGLDWLLKMHPRPNEFYYQVGSEDDHNSWRLPETDTIAQNPRWKPRPVYYGIGANLAGRCAAAFAIASRLYKPHAPAYAAQCLAAAESVYQLGLQNPIVVTTNPYDFYPETTWQDDMEWGAIELHKATGKSEYLFQAHHYARQAGPAETYTSVYNVHAMAHAALFPYSDRAQQAQLMAHLRVDAEYTRRLAESNPYGLGTPYVWGTAEAAAGAAITCMAYADLSGEQSYRNTARRQRDFILGANPFDICCLVGAGTRYPLFPHHQVANIKKIDLLGALVGGPASDKDFQSQKISLTGAGFGAMVPSPTPGKDVDGEVAVYHDVVSDYVTNEPANDYTVKFLLLTAFYIA